MTGPAHQPAPVSLAGAPWLVRAETQAIFRALQAVGADARAVGGAVRNAILDVPVTDVDIATPAKPDAIIQACEAAGMQCVPTGLEHGTVTVISGGIPFEVTTLREDVETFGRHANVAFTDDWAADARRRDFTINALYCTADGTVIDPLGGLADLQQRRVRFIGDAAQRIREDYLRILRFFRFHAEYGRGALDPDGVAACVRERSGLAALSAERIRVELLKLLVAPRSVPTLAGMHEFGLLAGLLGLAPRPDLFARTVQIERDLALPADALLRLSALAVAVEEDIAHLSDRLKLSHAERESLLVIDRRAQTWLGLDERAARRRLYELGPERWRRQLLAGAIASDVAATEPSWRMLYELPERWPTPQFPLRGADVLALGVQPGPAVGNLLREIEAWWIASDFAADEASLREQLRQRARQG
jgi:poly(A) polymerase